MKILKKAVSLVLILALLLSVFPICSFADENNEYRISNDYLSFMFNSKTGGFAIETAEGNPHKVLDNNIPLLYSEDKERSNGTSFITVKIGDKDYVFGQDYGFFGIDSSLGAVDIKENGRLMEIPWTIKGITVTLQAALDNNTQSNTTGNVGLSFVVKNNNANDENVSVRLLLDTALGNKIDAPYFIIDSDVQPTFTETEFSGDNVPQQIRSVDSVTEPSRLSYILTQANGWSGGGTKPGKIIIGHWANLANTRYDYTPDPYCDFSNYSNSYREPDSAAAIYWENQTVKSGETFNGELLYGVGNFSNVQNGSTDIHITTERVKLAADKKSYENNGEIKVTVNIDNTVDNAPMLSDAVFNLTIDDEQFEIVSGDDQVKYVSLGKETKTLEYTLRAIEQNDLCAGTIYASLAGVKTLSDGSQEDFETAAQRSIVLPSVGEVSEVQINKINPSTVYTDGEKAVTLSGKMKVLEAVLANDAMVKLKLIHTKTGHSVEIKKNNIAFLDDSGETLSFTTDEQLTVGEYQVVFEINDATIQDNLKCNSISAAEKLKVSADEKYKLKSYGLAALVRTTEGADAGNYDFFTFRTESEFLKFYHGESSATGELHGKKIEYDFGADEHAIKQHEILITVRADLYELKDESGKIFWQADRSSGDIIINNMLSYEGEKPLKIYNSGDEYVIEGDGLLKVINSINVWRSKWNISAMNGLAYTLDTERLAEELGTSASVRTLSLAFDGAATMIQAIGGFTVDLKYGELSSQWYDNSDGMVTYGIGFGGSISLPIKEKKKKEQPDLTADQEDISEELQNLFDESLTADQDDISADMTSMFDETPKTSSTGDKIKKDTKLSEGQLSAEVDNVLFGEKGEVKDGYVKVDDTGFIGIDTTISLALPKDLLGSLVSNSPGVYASVKIDTIENVYELNAGLNIKVIECEGVLAFKQVNVKKKDVIVPDKIEFYIRDGLKIPVAPPVLFIAGLGGGINDLADTIGGEFDTLPPITILLFTRLEAIGVLTGDFNAKVSLEGMSLTGDMKLKAKSLEKLMDLKAGINARWIEPWELNLYGNISIIDGLIKGGATITIADDFFYGYIFASICIPDSIPIVGGKELAGVEAAVSHEFIGANIKIIGISYGVIYYWGENVSFGKNIDLSPPDRDGSDLLSVQNADELTGYYGTNIHELKTVSLAAAPVALRGAYKEARVSVENARGQKALLIEIPYSGTGTPNASEIKLINPDGKELSATYDDGNGGGNMLVQNREDGDFIYITVTEEDLIINGEWKVRYTTDNIEISSFKMNGVDAIPELAKNGTAITLDSKNQTVTAGWEINGGSANALGTVDVYLTEDKDILNKIKTSTNNGDVLGVNIMHKEGAVLSSGKASETITLPDSLPNGKYYAVTTLSTTEGISLAISSSPIDFVNPNLPKKVEKVKISYGGNGELFVSVTDPADADYTHYLAEIVADDGTVLDNNIGQFEKGLSFVFGSEASLEPDKSYHVNVKTLREEYKKSDEEYKNHYYYGTDTVSSNNFVLPKANMPKLKEVKVNFNTDGEEINTSTNNVIIEYTFENDVFVEMDLNGSKVYAFGVDPDPKSADFSYFKKEWKFVLDDLEDGDYVVDFTAYTKDKDHIKGSETQIENAQLGFTVDTSAPVLSLAQRSVDRKLGNDDITVVFGANTVVADENGKYCIEGITEKSAKLMLDGEEITNGSDGVEIAASGSFKIERTLDANEMFKEHLITASDKAGNVSYITVYAVRKDGMSFERLELYLGDGDDKKEIPADKDGVKTINLENGKSAKLSVYAVSSSGQKFAVQNDAVEWSVLYSKNSLEMKDGTVSALIPGETAVKVKLLTAGITTDSGTRTDGISDYVIVNISQNSKSDLTDKIAEAKEVLANNPNASESKINDLNQAISEAQEVVDNPQATEDDYTAEVTKLSQAISNFLSGGSSGGKGSGGNGKGTSKKYNVSVSETENGTVKVSQSTVKGGDSLTITAVPDEGYVVSDMLINGESVGRKTVYTINSVKEDIEVKVIFAKKTELPFVDVIESDWFFDNVKYAYENGLLKGVSETEFEPQTEITRAMVVTVLYRAEGEPTISSGIPFEDVEKNSYYANAVAWAAQNGIVTGTSETTFDPNDNITREQFAAIIHRYAKFKGYDVLVGENTNILSYNDYEDISEYAISAMQYAVGAGLIKGRTETTLNPANSATRAEAAAILQRFIEANK